MTQVKAKTKWAKIGPRKLDRVVKLVRGKLALVALQELKFMPQKGARILEKVIHSAVANARNNYKLSEQDLVVRQAFVNKGFNMKRMRPRARGRVNQILKRTSHLTVLLESKEEA